MALIAIFLPWVTLTAGPLERDFSLDGTAKFFHLLGIVACAALAWLTVTRPQTQLQTLIALSVLTGLRVIALIYAWVSAGDNFGSVDAVFVQVDVSPGFGFLLYSAALIAALAGVVMLWIARSKPKTQVF